jgi:hypothetical protein
VDSAEGPSAARGTHDLHTHDDLLSEGGAHVRGKVLHYTNTAHSDHGYPHRAWGYSGAVSWCRGFDLIRSPTERAESHMRSEPNMFAHLVREPLSRHSTMDTYPYVCTPHAVSGDAPCEPCRVKSQARLAARYDGGTPAPARNQPHRAVRRGLTGCGGGRHPWPAGPPCGRAVPCRVRRFRPRESGPGPKTGAPNGRS